jgi:ACR3 family arsenite efflux pump ArsB
LVSYGETIFDYFAKGDTKKAVKQICAIFIGIVFAFAVHLSFLTYLTETDINAVFDMVVSGIVISRGSNYIFDVVKRIREGKKQAEDEPMAHIGFIDETDDYDVDDEGDDDE